MLTDGSVMREAAEDTANCLRPGQWGARPGGGTGARPGGARGAAGLPNSFSFALASCKARRTCNTTVLVDTAAVLMDAASYAELQCIA